MQGSIVCPQCEASITRSRGVSQDELLECPHCDWECTWQDYRSTFEGEFLNAGDMERFCHEFLTAFAAAKAPGRKLILVDTLIHRVHCELVGGKKPGAYAFIEGEISDIAAFLDRLTYGDGLPEEIRARRDAWRKKIRGGSRFWAGQLADDETPEQGIAG